MAVRERDMSDFTNSSRSDCTRTEVGGWKGERIFIELMTSDCKLKASIEGSE